MVRSPKCHAQSLLKIHKLFTKRQSNNSYELEFMDLLAHHEFGMNHKPFVLLDSENYGNFPQNDINYWLIQWVNYYKFVLESITLGNNKQIVCYESMVENQTLFENKISDFIGTKINISEDFHKPSASQSSHNFDAILLTDANKIYSQLKKVSLVKSA